MWYILDGIIILIVLAFVFLSIKKGFARSLIEVIGLVAAIVIAFTCSAPIASFIYDNAVEPSVINTVESTVNDATNDAKDAVDAVWNKMPVYITESEFLDLSKQELINSVESDITNETQEIAKNISVSFVKPITTKILSMVVSTIIVIVLIVIVGIIARQFNKIINKTVIGGANKALGGILGLIKGVAASTVFCLIISTILHLTKNGFWIFTYDVINSTYIFKYLMEFSPFI